MKNNGKPKQPALPEDLNVKTKNKGYPLYPASEDIYRKAKEIKGNFPEDFSETSDPNQTDAVVQKHSPLPDGVNDDEDLDVPGSELDDEQENIGSEDEENNFYSIGGDNHNDLEEANEEE